MPIESLVRDAAQGAGRRVGQGRSMAVLQTLELFDEFPIGDKMFF